jgi:hypothetical protein
MTVGVTAMETVAVFMAEQGRESRGQQQRSQAKSKTIKMLENNQIDQNTNSLTGTRPMQRKWCLVGMNPA